MIYLTEDLVASVKRRTLAPSSQKTFQDSDIISLLSEELKLKLVPQILSVREDYFLASKRSSLVANIEIYPLPERAIGNALKNVFYVMSDGVQKVDLPRLQLSDTIDFSSNSGTPSGYVLRGDYVQILPKPTVAQGSIEMWHLQRPSDLVATASVGAITLVSSGGGNTVFTVDTDLSSSLAVGDKVDFLSATSPTLLWAIDCEITAITTTQITVATSDVIDASSSVLPQVGDYICPARQANIPMIPQEFHPLLAEMAAARVMQALGHNDKLQAVNASIAEMKDAAMKMISNRVEDDPRALVNRRGISAYTSDWYVVRGKWRF